MSFNTERMTTEERWYHAEHERRITAEQQRDELIEILKSALKTAEFEHHPFRSWHRLAKDAIAKATGGEV